MLTKFRQAKKTTRADKFELFAYYFGFCFWHWLKFLCGASAACFLRFDFVPDLNRVVA